MGGDEATRINRSSHFHPAAEVDATARIGVGTQIWAFASVREHASIGRDCNIGRHVYIGPGVTVGDNAKIQNLAQIYEPSSLGDGVFIGPGVVITNDKIPRSKNLDGSAKTQGDWLQRGSVLEDGVSIGANSTIVSPVVLGKNCLVGAGSVVTKSFPPFSLIVGSPARRVGWVGESGKKLKSLGNYSYICPDTGKRFREVSGHLKEQ